MGILGQLAGTSNPHYETASCSPSGGYNLSCPNFIEEAFLSHPTDITLHSSSLRPKCTRGTQHKRAIPESCLPIKRFD
ncbi:hypothetical protein TNCV_3687891 [Trichonephila clavipes]|nr:hypothetical protein TNCV_3687891 [Trichonephila clavipes]